MISLAMTLLAEVNCASDLNEWS
jgi:hypothetical protein